MTAITHQKHDVARDILDLIEEYLTSEPGKAVEVAKGACQRLASRMTLQELLNWRGTLLRHKHTWTKNDQTDTMSNHNSNTEIE